MAEGNGRIEREVWKPSPTGEEEQPSGRREGEDEREGTGKEQGKQGDERSGGEGSGKRQEGEGEKQSGQDQESKKGEGKQHEPGKAEWAVGIVCAIIVLSAIGYLTYRAISGPDLPPLITVRAERVLPAGPNYLVEFKVYNEGGHTAQTLMVEGALMQDTVVVEKSTATVQFVPAEAEREGGLYFTKDPRKYRLELRPTGYDIP